MKTTHPQLPLGISPRPGERFDSFFVGGNQLLADVATTTAQQGSEQQLAIWGAAGSGKSHLLNAVCHAATAHGRTSAYLSLYDFVEQNPEMLRGLETIDVIAFDNLEALLHKDDWQIAMFHLINRARQQQVSIVTASLANPSSLKLLPDLVSRLVWGPVLRLVAPDDEQLAMALAERSTALGLTLPKEVTRYLLVYHSRRIDSLFYALDLLNDASLAEQRKLTVPFVKSILAANLPPHT